MKNIAKSGLFVIATLFVTTSLTVAENLPDAALTQTDNNTTVTQSVFPKWPERKVYMPSAHIPPPPPGPYMSTALSNVATGFPAVDSTRKTQPVRPVIDAATPWPERRRPPRRWLPESGAYQFVPQDQPSSAPSGRYDRRTMPPRFYPRYQRPSQGQY